MEADYKLLQEAYNLIRKQYDSLGEKVRTDDLMASLGEAFRLQIEMKGLQHALDIIVAVRYADEARKKQEEKGNGKTK